MYDSLSRKAGEPHMIDFAVLASPVMIVFNLVGFIWFNISTI